MLDGYVRKVTLEQRTAVFERTMAELEKRKHFELMVGGAYPSPLSSSLPLSLPPSLPYSLPPPPPLPSPLR